MRALRILFIVLAVVIGLPIALLLIGFGLAQTGPGKRFIADQAGGLASTRREMRRSRSARSKGWCRST